MKVYNTSNGLNADFYPEAVGKLNNENTDPNALPGVSLSVDDLGYIKQGKTVSDGDGFTPTQTQLDAMNSGITSEEVEQINTNKNNISIEDITNKVSMETGFTIDTSYSKLYKQGKHIFGNLVLKKSTGVYNSTGDIVATITDYPPILTVVNAIGLTNTVNQIQNIGWIYISSASETPAGSITIRDGVGSINNCAVIQIDYVTA